eukprot:3617790-Amphidinium_carterae.1
MLRGVPSIEFSGERGKGSMCCQVLVKHPAVGNAETKVEFKNPKFNVLPQLVMDVVPSVIARMSHLEAIEMCVPMK